MRYEDASSSLNSAASAPDARNDEDVLAAGSKGPASGNTITGAGTVTGTAGADLVTNGPGHIVALEGANSSDTADGGSLHAAGRYGDLSMDSRGSYRYERNEDAPDGARDVFRYTLADSEGARDSATLTINIGRDPLKIDANAQQLVPGPDGVVTLPPGVELSDVHVVGRNLVIDMPDGTQMIIVDGAVFVPQLVLGGVEVPATNLAALLIDTEPQPAAGTPQSSGGNFEIPVPPLDPGIPLGDLIPPTELGYVPPIFHDVGQFVDEEPEIFVQPDGQPASVAAVDSVNEAGLPSRNEGEPAGSGEIADGNGSNNSDTREVTTGVILVDSPDDPSVVRINGEAVTGVIGQQIDGDFGTLFITSVSDSEIGYRYVLDDNNLLGNASHDDFSVSVTDRDGDVATATLRIDIIDDVPTARNDTDATVEGVATGNVITDAAPGDAGDSDTNAADTVGADNATLTSVTGFGGSSDSSFNEEGDLSVNGQFGSLAIDAQGNYTYTVNPNAGGGGVDVFTYTLTDGDGDTTTATLTITNPDLVPHTDPNPIVRTDDDAVPGAGGNDGGPEDNVDAENLTGTLSGSGGDGDLTFDLLTSAPPTGFTYVNGPNGSVLVQQVQHGSTVTVLTITIDASNGDYTVTQNAPILHPTLNGQPGDDIENNVSFTINYTVTDVDGDPASGTLVINVDDDTPTASQVTISKVVDEDGLPTGNVGGVNDVAGAAVVASGNVSTLFNPGADQPLSYNLLTDTSLLPALTSNHVAVTYSVDGNTLTASAGENDVFTFTLNPATGAYTFTLLDQLDHPSLDGQPGDDTENPTASDIRIQLGSIIQATDDDGDSVTANANGLVITVDDDSPEPFDGCPDDVIAVNDVGSTFTGDLNLPPVGADEPGTVSFVVDNGDPVLDNEGQPITSNGDPLFYFVNGDGVLEARVGDGTGEVIFTITINGDGTFTYDQLGTIGEGGVISFDDLSSTSAGNDQFAGVGADDPETTVDLLLSAEKDGASDTVNTDSDSIGSQNQSMDNGETVRIDFVSDLASGAATPSGFGYGDHVSTSSFIGLIPQVQGEQDQTTAFTVWALDSSNTQATEPDRNPAGGFSDSTITAVEEVTVKDYLTGESTTADVTGFTTGVFTAVAYGISVRVNSDGSVTFSGIQQGDSYGINTGTGEFNAIAVQAEPAGTGGSTQDSFDLGVFSIGTSADVQPVDLTVPIALTDSDGDSVVCDIDINLGPPVAAPDITVTVNEAGLPVIGSDPGSSSEIATGDLQGQVSGGTGPYEFTLISPSNGAFGNLILNSDGTFTYTLDTPFDSQPSANDGTNPELGAESFTFEATDSLGHTQTGTIGVNIIDDVPTIDVSASGEAGVLLTTQDAETIGGLTDHASSTADFSGVFDLAFVAGADGAASTPDLNYVLDISAAAVDSGLNQGGANIYLHVIDGKVVGSTSDDPLAVNAGNTVFDVSVNGDGVVTLTQYSQIDHPVQAGLNDAPFADQFINMTDSLVTLTASESITDNDGDSDSDSVTINIGNNLRFADDGPTAVADTDSIAAGFFGTATGNVMTGTDIAVGADSNGSDGSADNVGADTPGRISQVSFTSDLGGVPVVQTITAGGSTVINGDYGVLTLFSDGDYSYDRNTGSAGGVDDVFTYTLRDSDGDTVTATLTINIGINPPVATTAHAAVDDDGLANANAAGTDDINANTSPTIDDLDGAASSEASFRGQLGATGGDGDKHFSLIAPVGQVAVGQEMVTFSFIGGVLTATIADSPDASREGDPLFTVSVNDSGEYIVTLVDNVLHGDDANNNEDGVEVSVNIPYQVVDDGGSSSAANGTLTIDFNDDVPTARTDADSVTEDGPTTADGNVITGSGGSDANGTDGVADTPGADGATVTGIKLPAAGAYTSVSTAPAGTEIVGTYGTLTIHADGSYSYLLANSADNVEQLDEGQVVNDTFNYQLTDGDGDTSLANVVITITGNNDTPVVTPSAVAVSDEGRGSKPNPDTVGVDDTTNSPTASDTLGITDPDGTTSFTIALGTPLGSYTVDGVAITWAVNPAGTVLTGSVAGLGSVITVTLTDTAGGYSVNLLHAIDQATTPTEVDRDIVVPVTVNDGFTTVNSSITVTVEDDSPVYVSEVDAAITDPTEPLTFNGTFNYRIGGDEHIEWTTDHEIALTAFRGEVGGVDIVPGDITFVSANTTTEVFTIAFEYAPNPNEPDTLVSNLATVTFNTETGAYSVVLDDPIQSYSLPSVQEDATVTFYGSLGGASQYEAAVASFNVGTDDELHIQFTGDVADNTVPFQTVGTGTAGTYQDGDIFIGNDSWVSISSTAIAAGGNSLQPGNILDFNFYEDNPEGTTGGDPTTSASGAFLVLDQLGSGEDMVLLLKLADPANPGDFVTRALIVDYDDIYVEGETTPEGYPVAGTNQGVVIVEQADYAALVPAGYELVGMQLTTSTQGITGDGYNFNGLAGEESTGTTAFDTNQNAAGTYDQDVIKILDVGVIIQTENQEALSLELDVTVTDADGDSFNETLLVNPPTADALAFTAMASQESESAKDTSHTVMASLSDEQRTMSAANNNSVLLGSVAAAGLASATQVAAHTVDSSSNHVTLEANSAAHGGALAQDTHRGVESIRNVISGEDRAAAHEQQQAASSTHQAAQATDHSLTNASAHQSQAPAELLQATEAAAQSAPAQSSLTSGGVGMPSAAMLAAANANDNAGEGQAHSHGVVGRVLAEALAGGGHGPNIDAVLDAVANQAHGGNAAVQALASHGPAAVSGWDTANIAGFPGGHSALTMETMVLHHDAVMPAA